ncbi:hypothetical protein F2P81_016474 [Scophthalmus maximus]|uniref:Uncharacterized protein n=1 Tax=Scophthalmus maximus TaxID=52904 RepID=A0A6A4SHD6_SCOMX|nr:hypothetical protein F2P81_016474 [Scophthalmus maximus]
MAEERTVHNIPEAVDDFLRNFLRRVGLSRTLRSFEAEWYNSGRREALAPETPTREVFFIPDALTHRQLLQSALDEVRRDTGLLRQEVLAVEESLVRMQRERDFHRLQCRRVTEDKDRLLEDVKQLKKHLESRELRQLDVKPQAARRQRRLVSSAQNTSDKEKPKAKKERSARRSDTSDNASAKSSTSAGDARDSEFPAGGRQVIPRQAPVTSPRWRDPSSLGLSCSIRAHRLPISCISLHPGRPILASASDDRSWRLWTLPTSGEKVGQMMLTGEGHADWLSCCSFHPDGTKLATTSGDATVRLWDFSRGSCVLTLSGHSQPTWGCSFHHSGHFLASCSAGRTARVWDLNSQRCRLTLRHHTASVNSVCFLPFSNLLLTCSADKTLALWDARLGVCTAALHGHAHPCNHATVSPAGDTVASCDSRGVVNLWDVRRPESPMATVDAGPQGANQAAFSPSGKRLAVACSDGRVRLVEVDTCAESSLPGDGDGVESVTFDHTGATVMSAGTDGLINVWSEVNAP